MPTESEIIISFIFKRSGKQEMNKSDFYLTLSMDLNWCSPKQAKKLLDQAINQELIKEKNEIIKPNFDVNTIDVPVGFYPSKTILEEKPSEKPVKEINVLDKMIERIVEKSKLNRKEVENKIKDIEKEKNIELLVAALFIGKEYSVVIDDFFEKIEKELLF